MTWRNADEQAEWRERCRQAVRDRKDVPCSDCGERYPYWVMDFDHRPGEVKEFNVNKGPGRHGMPAILAEMDKCDVVCSNCHRTRTHIRLPE